MTGRGAAPAPDRARGTGGQSTVEFALVLPLAMLLLLAVVQVGVIVRSQVMLTHAGREAVRSAAVSPDTAAVRRAAEEAGGLERSRLAVAMGERGAAGSMVRVRVDYSCPTDLPLIGFLLPDVELHAEATMLVEQ